MNLQYEYVVFFLHSSKRVEKIKYLSHHTNARKIDVKTNTKKKQRRMQIIIFKTIQLMVIPLWLERTNKSRKNSNSEWPVGRVSGCLFICRIYRMLDRMPSKHTHTHIPLMTPFMRFVWYHRHIYIDTHTNGIA